MSRGRKPNQKAASIDWSYIFKKNAGTYFNIILSHLGCFSEIGDGHGIEVLNRIRKEKEERKLKDKPYPKIAIDEIPYKIPENWVWCRLGEMSINRDGERNPISLADRNNREKIYDYYGASGVIDKIDGYTHEGELLLIGEDGANLVSRSTPIAFIATGKYWVNNHAHVLETVHRITLDYLKCYINSIDIKPFVTGGFQPKLSQGNLNIIPVPLPPISFQEKIIEFVTDFENNKIKSNGFYFNSQIERKIIELHKSQLSAAEIITENNFQLSQLSNLNQAILQEAVQGKLVPQDPKDEPASELLKRIKAEKAILSQLKGGKKEKPLPPIKPAEIPFEIPENWVWCRLGEICNNITKGSSPNWQGVQYVSENEGILFITSKNVDSFKIDLSKATYVEKEFNEIEPRSILKKGDILTNIVGASIGRTAIFDLDVVANINQAVCILRIEHSRINKDYLLNLMNSNLALKLMTENSFAPGRANLSMSDIANFPIPLPPLSEQKRIVAEIEKQLAITIQLKQHIITNQQATEQLLKALLHEAFEVKETEGT